MSEIKEIVKSIELGGRTLTLKTGKLAPQADVSVLATYGETVALATVVSAPLEKELDYFPLSVEYQERLYAGGRIKGSRWVKREGRPTDEEILSGRVIDRSIRPLFPKTYKKEVQLITMVVQVDFQNDPTQTAAFAACAALNASALPFQGPVSILTVGLIDGKFILNPTNDQEKDSQMDLVVACTKEAITMVEAGAKEVSEEDVIGGIEFAAKESKKLFAFFDEFAKEIGNKKEKYEKPAHKPELIKLVKKVADDKLAEVISHLAKKEGKSEEWDALLAEVKEAAGEEDAMEAGIILDETRKEIIREGILKGVRPDGRKLTEVRPLSSMVGILSRTHGSALFQRGASQAMTIATLGSLQNGQLLESAEGEYEKNYIHHYVMPPYSTGETGRVGQPGRREIGHGALAERALFPVIPSVSKFPYAMRLVSEILSSNGSTSMASTCGSTLALMDAGVPIKSPVSGIAMGLVIESDKKFAVMSDIAGIEDFNGDMDFKVTGTAKGITALQLDVKTLSLTPKIMAEALAQGKEGRAFILKHMLETIAEPRAEVSKYAPKVKTIKIDVERIGEVIGPSGKIIKKIIADSGAQVDVKEDGAIDISGVNAEAVDKAIAMIEGIVKVPQPGEVYEGTVQRIQPFGAFVEILPGKDGLVHVSDMSTEYVGNPEDVVSIGQKVQVRVKEVDNMGRLNLSMVLDPAYDAQKEQNGGGGRRSGGGSGGNSGGGFAPRMGGGPRLSSERPRRSFDRQDDRRPRTNGPRRSFGGSSDHRDREGQGGPHFPASRLVSSNQDAPQRRFDR